MRLNKAAVGLIVCWMASLLGCARTAVAQIPDSRPKPGQGGVVKLHGQPYLVVRLPAGTPYQLGPCVAGRPVLTFTALVANQGNLANRTQPPEIAVALDDTLFPERWQGQVALPEIPPGQSATVSIPVMYVASLPVSGAHNFRLYVLGDVGKDPTTKAVHPANVHVVFPDGYCAPPSPRPKPQQPVSPNKKPKLVLPGLLFSANSQIQKEDSWRGASL